MFDFFTEGNNFYEYPSFEVAIYSLLLALVLSIGMAFSYKLTYEGRHFSSNLFQAMVLSALVTSMIMMAVGNNIAVGFGIIGAVAIIRFRTTIQNPRNIIFMFGALSIGITTGVQGYAVSVAGTTIFCATAFLLRSSPFRMAADDHFEVAGEFADEATRLAFEEKLAHFAIRFELTDVRKREERHDRYTYTAILKTEDMKKAFMELRQFDLENLQISRVRTMDQL